MKTDDIFYQIFQTTPELAFELINEPPPCNYEFRAQEVKAFGFRTDGLLFPQSDNPNDPILLLEAQMQPDPELYYRLLNELTTYLRQYQPPNPWRVIVLYPRRAVERVVPQLDSIRTFCNLYCFYLDELGDGVSLGQDMLRLLVTPQSEAQIKARELSKRAQQQLSDPVERNNFVDLLLETVTRIFPDQSKEEIRNMLESVPVTQTRFYQEVKQEGIEQGIEQGMEQGRSDEARSLVMRLISRRLGPIPAPAQTQVQQLTLEQTESLIEALLDLTSLDELLSWLEQFS